MTKGLTTHARFGGLGSLRVAHLAATTVSAVSLRVLPKIILHAPRGYRSSSRFRRSCPYTKSRPGLRSKLAPCVWFRAIANRCCVVLSSLRGTGRLGGNPEG